MNINSKALIVRDLYVYDIKSCHYTILEKLGYDMSSIEKENKLKRNVQIGQLMKENSKLISILRSTTSSVVDQFILKNKILKNEIIVRSYDGIIITRPINDFNYNDDIKLDLRDTYQNFIISSDRCNYIALNNTNESIIKGVADRYETMDYYYSRLLKINYLNKVSIFKSIQNIKDEIVNSDDPELFCVPVGNNKYEIQLIRYNKMKISGTIIQMIDLDDIDKEFYFDKYLTPFIKSIVIEFI